MTGIDWTAVGQALGVAIGGGFIAAAVVYWLTGRRERSTYTFECCVPPVGEVVWLDPIHLEEEEEPIYLPVTGMSKPGRQEWQIFEQWLEREGSKP